MPIQIDPHAAVPIYAQLVEQVRNQILSGVLVSGEALPSVRQLADELAVNSLTVQKAYKLLQADGLILIKKGVGAFVGDSIKALSPKEKQSILSQQLRPVVQQAIDLNFNRDRFNSVVESVWKE